MHTLTKFFSPFCINKAYMHKHKSFSPFLYKTRKWKQTCIYKLIKYFSPFLSIHQQRGENKSTNNDIYVIYIHEERDVKSAPLHTCIT